MKLMKYIGNIVIVFGIVFGLFAIRSFWVDWRYENASISVKANVLSVEVKKVKPMVASLIYVLQYMRDSKLDTIVHKKNVVYSLEEPLPSNEKLKNKPQYVRYVPEGNLLQTSLSSQIIVNDDGEYDSEFRYSKFITVFVCGFIGYFIRRF